MTLTKILNLEPKLIDLIKEGSTILKEKDWYKRNEFWYKKLKPEMLKLVGFMARNPKLNSTDAYDIIYRFFIDFLEI